MEIDDIIKIEVHFNRPEKTFHPGELVEGNLVVTPYRNIGIQEFNIHPTYQIKGLVNTTKKLSNQINLVQNTEWKGGIDYTYHFSFKLNQLSSYSSPNLSINWFIETSLKLNTESRTELRKVLGKSMQFLKMTNPDSAFNQKLPLKVLPNNQQRSIVQKTSSIFERVKRPKSANGLLIAAAIIFIIGFRNTYLLILSIFLGIQGLGQLDKVKGLISKSVAKLTVVPYNHQQFKAIFNLGNSYKRIAKLELNFKVLEEVKTTFNSKETKSEVIHSEFKTFHQDELNHQIEALYNYPQANIPSSIILKNHYTVKFTWLIECKFIYNDGKTFTSLETFKATWDKVKQPQLLNVG